MPSHDQIHTGFVAKTMDIVSKNRSRKGLIRTPTVQHGHDKVSSLLPCPLNLLNQRMPIGLGLIHPNDIA